MRFPGVDGKSRGKPGAKCSVPFCGEALNQCPLYLKKFRVCVRHASMPELVLEGRQVRFCQQCGRFQPLHDFDGERKNCRASLARHNERRRKNNERHRQLAAQKGTQRAGAAAALPPAAPEARPAPASAGAAVASPSGSVDTCSQPTLQRLASGAASLHPSAELRAASGTDSPRDGPLPGVGPTAAAAAAVDPPVAGDGSHSPATSAFSRLVDAALAAAAAEGVAAGEALSSGRPPSSSCSHQHREREREQPQQEERHAELRVQLGPQEQQQWQQQQHQQQGWWEQQQWQQPAAAQAAPASRGNVAYPTLTLSANTAWERWPADPPQLRRSYPSAVQAPPAAGAGCEAHVHRPIQLPTAMPVASGAPLPWSSQPAVPGCPSSQWGGALSQLASDSRAAAGPAQGMGGVAASTAWDLASGLLEAVQQQAGGDRRCGGGSVPWDTAAPHAAPGAASGHLDSLLFPRQAPAAFGASAPLPHELAPNHGGGLWPQPSVAVDVPSGRQHWSQQRLTPQPSNIPAGLGGLLQRQGGGATGTAQPAAAVLAAALEALAQHVQRAGQPQPTFPPAAERSTGSSALVEPTGSVALWLAQAGVHPQGGVAAPRDPPARDSGDLLGALQPLLVPLLAELVSLAGGRGGSAPAVVHVAPAGGMLGSLGEPQGSDFPSTTALGGWWV
ncbi:hypothetical protein N2152v2_002024 [Parachlorella kessleri]